MAHAIQPARHSAGPAQRRASAREALPAPVTLTDLPAALERERNLAAAAFRRLYHELTPTAAARALRATTELFAQTSDLADRGAVTGRERLTALRHTTPSPVSADDIARLAGGRTKAHVLAGVAELFDDARFPWLEQRRPATAGERATAIAGVTATLADTMYKTAMRSGVTRIQEGAVAAALGRAGYTRVHLASVIAIPEDLAPGQFCERQHFLIDGSDIEADFLVRGHDGRCLLIEAKYSGSSTNGTKRLSRECGDKKSKAARHKGIPVDFLVVAGGCFSASAARDFVGGGGDIVFDHMLADADDAFAVQVQAPAQYALFE